MRFGFVANISLNFGLIAYGSQGNKCFEMIALVFIVACQCAVGYVSSLNCEQLEVF